MPRLAEGVVGKDEKLNLRFTREERDMVMLAASQSGKRFSTWARECLLAACKEQLGGGAMPSLPLLVEGMRPVREKVPDGWWVTVRKVVKGWLRRFTR